MLSAKNRLFVLWLIQIFYIVTNQSTCIIKHGILSLSLFMSIRSPPSQKSLGNIKISRTALIQININIIRSIMHLIEPPWHCGTNVHRMAIPDWSWQIHPFLQIGLGIFMIGPTLKLIPSPMIKHGSIGTGEYIPSPVQIITHPVSLILSTRMFSILSGPQGRAAMRGEYRPLV